MTDTHKKKVSRLDYCQFLLSSQVNYTLTHFADHSEQFSHDAINRYVLGDQIPPRLVWENVQPNIITSENGFIIFDDFVLDKEHSAQIELVRYQWSGNAQDVIKGIGVVTCVYVNPDSDQFWIIDYRIFAPEVDKKSKLDHLREMLFNAVHHKQLPFRIVLMDTWYAAKDELLFIEKLGKIYYCPVKDNRLVCIDRASKRYHRVTELLWSQDELRTGRLVHLRDFPAGHQVKLFRFELSTERMEYIITNEVSQDWTPATQEAWGWRPKIEEFHRESKQLTGIENCQCRKARIVRNHIGCAMLVWVRLKQVAYETGQTIYQVKHELFSDYLRQQLRSPAVQMTLA
jgi:DDE superfamily endonuclease